MTCRSRCCAPALGAIAVLSAVASAGLTYTFDTTAEGWSSINDTSALTWDGTLGNPPGALRGVDAVNGDIWFFSAPAGDLGDLSGLFGQAISYDIRGITGDQQDLEQLADVMIKGPAGIIGIDIDVQPINGQWTSWSAVVDASGGWRPVTDFVDGELGGSPVSEQLIKDVLANADGLYIRGEYTSGNDSCALDNVVIAVPDACPEDLNGSGTVDSGDLNILLGGFGCAPGSGPCEGDIDGDGDTDSGDLNLLLAAFGEACP